MSGINEKKTKEKNILILEDEPSSLRYLIRIVENCSPLEVHVFGYTNLRDAYQCLEHREVSLFIVDIMLTQNEHNREGYQFIEEMRKREEYHNIPVIFVTGLEEPRKKAYEDLHCLGYIQKPYDVDEIHRMVRRGLTYQPVEVRSRLSLKKDGILYLLDADQIVYIRIIGKQLFVKSYGKPLCRYGYQSMKEIISQIKTESMISCGKGLLVNGRYLDHLDRKERKLYLKDDTAPLKLTISGLKDSIHSITDSMTQ